MRSAPGMLVALALLSGCALRPVFHPGVAVAQVRQLYDNDAPLCVWLPSTGSNDRSTTGFLPQVAREGERALFRPFVDGGVLEEVASRAGSRSIPVWRYRVKPGLSAVVTTCWDRSVYPWALGPGLVYARREVVSIKPRAPYQAYCYTWFRSAQLEYRVVEFADWYDEARFAAMTNIRYPRSDAGRLQTREIEFELMNGAWGINMRQGHRRPCVPPPSVTAPA